MSKLKESLLTQSIDLIDALGKNLRSIVIQSQNIETVTNTKRQNQNQDKTFEDYKLQNYKLKKQNNQLQKHLKKYKKYVEFIQGYNENLKQQIVYWMNKKYENPENIVFANEKKNSQLIKQLNKLQQEGQKQKNQLKQLKKYGKIYTEQSEYQTQTSNNKRIYPYIQQLHPNANSVLNYNYNTNEPSFRCKPQRFVNAAKSAAIKHNSLKNTQLNKNSLRAHGNSYVKKSKKRVVNISQFST